MTPIHVEAKKCIEIKSWRHWLLLKANHILLSIYIKLLFVICLALLLFAYRLLLAEK